ncbi:MAG: hypothetical protein WD648_14815, partial [Planctomycetaceae bacterium]
HGGPKIKNVVRKHPTAIGLATLRRDGFVSLTAGNEPGTLSTKPFNLPEGDLHLNVKGAKGQIVSTLCDADGKPLDQPGSNIHHGGGANLRIRWPHPIPPDLRGKPVRLQIELTNAELYSYWWE